MKGVENLPVIYIFHQSLQTIQLSLIVNAFIQRSFWIFLGIIQKTFPSRTIQETFSTATCFLIISYMLLLLYERNILLLENWKDHIPKKVLLTLKLFRKLFLRAIRIQYFRNLSFEESLRNSASYKNDARLRYALVNFKGMTENKVDLAVSLKPMALQFADLYSLQPSSSNWLHVHSDSYKSRKFTYLFLIFYFIN